MFEHQDRCRLLMAIHMYVDCFSTRHHHRLFDVLGCLPDRSPASVVEEWGVYVDYFQDTGRLCHKAYSIFVFAAIRRLYRCKFALRGNGHRTHVQKWPPVKSSQTGCCRAKDPAVLSNLSPGIHRIVHLQLSTAFIANAQPPKG